MNGRSILCFLSTLLLLSTNSGAFMGKNARTGLYHDHDALDCYDCHVGISSSSDDFARSDSSAKSMLKKPTTDLCLSCHSEFGADAVQAPYVATSDGKNPGIRGRAMPAGDFYYSSKDPKKGHNPGKTRGRQSSAMPSDPKLSVAPGGNFPTDNWDCCSCHEPHYRFSPAAAPWRQLKRKVNGIVHTGVETAAVGVESSGGNQGPTTAGFRPIESNSRGGMEGMEQASAGKSTSSPDGANLFLPEGETNKNVYKGDFSSFCATCHGDFHGDREASMPGGGAYSSSGNTAAGGEWLKHPTAIAIGASAEYNTGNYTKMVTNRQGTNPNPRGYDWKYPLVKVDGRWSVTSSSIPGQIGRNDRIMCLTCHKAHASQYDNMLRWDPGKPAFIANGEIDGYHEGSNGDNPAYGCNKCHLMGGANAFVKAF